MKTFIIQKSKSATNLNHEEGKQEETTIDQSTKISDSWGKNVEGLIYPSDYFSRWGQFSLGPFDQGAIM